MKTYDLSYSFDKNLKEIFNSPEEVKLYSHFDLKEYDTALEYFEDTLEMRKGIVDQSLVESTLLAIKVTKTKLRKELQDKV